MQLSKSLTTSNKQRNKLKNDLYEKFSTCFDGCIDHLHTGCRSKSESCCPRLHQSDTTDSIAKENVTATDTSNHSVLYSLSNAMEDVLIPIIAIIAVFGFPVFILFIIFFFRYKNRKARYRLVEQALAAGQPLPEDFLKEDKPNDPRTQGIKNIFTGIGLFIFLWAITGEFSIGTIGLLITFMGIGKWIIGRKKDENQENDSQR